MKVAYFDFAPPLRGLLKRDLRNTLVELRFRGPQSVKHLIESLGIPHTEIGPMMINGQNAGLERIAQDGDRIVVNPFLPDPDNQVEPSFLLDVHLGRLASHLRMLGLDCLYKTTYEDKELVQISVSQGRILLSRDRLLLMHKVITRGYLLRSLDTREQLHEVSNRYRLMRWVKPFQRCLRCNHPLQAVAKETILEKLEPLTKKYYHKFKLCPFCDQVYWKGSHYEQMLRLISEVSDNQV